jgi:hypothetical protein
VRQINIAAGDMSRVNAIGEEDDRHASRGRR